MDVDTKWFEGISDDYGPAVWDMQMRGTFNILGYLFLTLVCQNCIEVKFPCDELNIIYGREWSTSSIIKDMRHSWDT